ncbi:MAG: response regulator [Cyanobacteria bacterium J06641_5]
MANRTVLVIDDSIMIRKMVASILADRFDVIEAKDGFTGLDIAREYHPDVILLDFVMPKMDGYDTMQAIRKDGELRETPIVLMSGLKEEVTSRIPEPFEGFDFLEKPFEADVLISQIQKTLQITTGARSLEEEPVAADISTEALMAKLTEIQTIFIQGTETLIQREVSTRIAVMDKRLAHQESGMGILDKKLDRLIKTTERQNQGLALVVKELRQIHKLLAERR